MVNIQHEYGIFGGAYGEMVIEFLDKLRVPAVTTLHTVLYQTFSLPGGNSPKNNSAIRKSSGNE
jgi:hypothetical protein